MFETVLDYIARTNLFNFIIFAGIICYLIIKLDVKGSLEKGTEAVADKIENSANIKSESELKLQTIEDKVSGLADEIDGIIKQSQANAELVGGQILADAEKTADNIQTNTLKLIENETGVIKNDIMRRVSVASVEVAREQIVNELGNNSELHNKLIDESVEAVNGVKI